MIKHNVYEPINALETSDEDFLSTTTFEFLANLPHSVFAKRLDGTCFFINQTLQTFADDLDDSNAHAPWVAALLSNDRICETEQIVRDSGQTVGDIEIKVSNNDSSLLVFKLDCLPLHNAQAELIGTINILRDYTKPYHQEQQLIESTNLMQAVLDHLPVRVFWKDAELNYLGCNTIFANDMGFETTSQLVGHDDFQTGLTREEAFLCRGGDAQVIKSQQPQLGMEEVLGNSEDKMWVRISKVPLRLSAGEALGILGMYEDIGQQKMAQFELENALRKERELNELKTRFISTVSHEFRNPLAAIQTNVDLLLYLGESATVEAQSKRLNTILDQITRMERLMESVLFIGREDIQDVERQHIAINMANLAKEVTQASAEPNRITLMYTGEQQPIIGLPLHLTQIVQNLLSNALLYSAENVDCQLEWQPDKFILSITDQGIGIPEQDKPHIFDSFFRSKNVGLIHGNGLGLYIVQRAVSLHNGTIHVESTPEQGTTFQVTLPLKPQALS